MDNNYFNNVSDINNTPDNDTNPKHGFSVASLICGILSIPCMCCGIGIIPGILAIIFAIMSRYDYYGKKRMEGISVAGLVLGIVGTLFSAIVLFYVVMIFTDPELSSIFQSAYESAMHEATKTANAANFFKFL